MGEIMGNVSRTSADELDKFTGYQVFITGDHTYIHQGKGFSISGTTGSVAAAGTYSISFVTPSDKWVHMRPVSFSSTANTLQCRLSEGSTMSSGTTTIAKNRNRNSGKLSKVTVAVGATLSAEGNIMEYGQAGSGANPANSAGGTGDGSNLEWVLAPNSTYSIRFENVGTVTATVGYYNIFWYEEDRG